MAQQSVQKSVRVLPALQVRRKEVLVPDMAWVAAEFAGRSLVIYVRTKFMAEKMIELLPERRWALAISPEEAAAAAPRFAAGELDLVYAIGPFAPQVPRDAVVHYGIPRDLRAYAEELGERCGAAALFFNDRDRYEVRRTLKKFGDDEQRREWVCTEEYLTTKNCRQQLLEAYGGRPSEGACGRCDNCSEQPGGDRLVADFHDNYKNLAVPRMAVAIHNFVAQYNFFLPFAALERRCVESREVITYVAEKKRREVFADLVHVLVKKGYADVVYGGEPLAKSIRFTKKWTQDFLAQTALMHD